MVWLKNGLGVYQIECINNAERLKIIILRFVRQRAVKIPGSLKAEAGLIGVYLWRWFQEVLKIIFIENFDPQLLGFGEFASCLLACHEITGFLADGS